MASLGELPDVASRQIAAWLECDELRQLAAVCRTTACAAVYHPRESLTLILPPIDPVRARRLVASIHERDPTAVARFAWLELTRSWHVDLLGGLSVRNLVRRLRVRNNAHADSENVCCRQCDACKRALVASVDAFHASRMTLDTLCRRLAAFPDLTELDLSGTSIGDVAPLVPLVALVSDVTPLSALVHLQVLLLREVDVADMRWVEHLTELRRLEVTQR